MIFLLCAVAWIALGLMVVAWNCYTEERPFHEEEWTSYTGPAGWLMVVAVVLAPLSCVWLLAKRVGATAREAGKNKRTIAAELEKELAAARREIDAMFKREKAPSEAPGA